MYSDKAYFVRTKKQFQEALSIILARVPRLTDRIRRGWIALIFLLLDILFNNCSWFFTHGTDKVWQTPEIWLPVKWFKLFWIILPDLSWWRWFKCIYKISQIDLRRCIEQNVYMVRHWFESLYDNSAFLKVIFCIRQQVLFQITRYNRMTVFRYKYRMI